MGGFSNQEAEAVRAAAAQFPSFLNGPIAFQVMNSALELGLLDLLSRRPGATSAQIRKALGLSTGPAKVLLTAGCAMGLIRLGRGRRYWINPFYEELIVRRQGVRRSLEVMQHYVYRPMFHLTEALRTGTHVGIDRELRGHGNLYYRAARDQRLRERMSSLMAAEVDELADSCCALKELGLIKRLVDVGGGDASLAIAVAKRVQNLSITVLDLPALARDARRRVRDAGLSDRIDIKEGDFSLTALPQGVDGVMFCRIFVNLSLATARRLVRGAYRALARGGWVMIQASPLSNDADTGPLSAALWSVRSLCAVTGTAVAHSARDYRAWLRSAGFRKIGTYRSREDFAWFVGQKP